MDVAELPKALVGFIAGVVITTAFYVWGGTNWDLGYAAASAICEQRVK